jgi:hypothetical protein
VIDGAPVAQLDRASAFEAAANSIQVVASVALMSYEPSLCCSDVAPNHDFVMHAPKTPERGELKTLEKITRANG